MKHIVWSKTEVRETWTINLNEIENAEQLKAELNEIPSSAKLEHDPSYTRQELLFELNTVTTG